MTDVDLPYTIRNMTVCDVKSLGNFKLDEFTIIYPDVIYIRHVKYFPNLSLVLEINKSVEGFIIGSYTTYNTVLYGHITSIFISEGFRGCGFGGKLMNEFEENSRGIKCQYVNLYVNDRNTPAIEFYKKRNYYVHKKLPRYYNDAEDALEMRKDLI